MATAEPPERSLSFQPGQSFGKFYLVQLIGEGGTARIFKALQQPISRLVALKIPNFPQTGGVLTPDEFLSEATLMARLDHGNIVRIHDFGVEDGKAFICMEHVEGWNLLQLIERCHPLSVSAVLAIGQQILEGLMHSHSRDVLHQDLSPANVLVSRSGSAKLTDFGMAGKRPVSKGGSVVGTPAFLSPEHVAGEACTARSDLFSFGSLLYFISTGGPLFDPGEDNGRIRDAFQEIEKARWQPPLDKLRALPASISQLIRAALEGGDPESMLRDFRALWAQSEGRSRPEDALRRELNQDPGRDAGADPASEKEIREGYLRLRSEGRHREAVALLERALKRHPDNPVLRDLLATPPVRAKSAPVTMEVSSAVGPARGGRMKKSIWAAGAGVLAIAIAAVTAGLLSRGAQGEGLSHGPADMPPPANPVQALPERTPSISDAPATEPPTNRTRPDVQAAPAGAVMTRVSATLPGTLPTRPAAALRGPRPPALALSGPPGTRVLVNDTLEFLSPAPKGGWALPAGLINLVVTRPDSPQPISSSLFVAADTLYMLNLEEDGGFSVSRHGR